MKARHWLLVAGFSAFILTICALLILRDVWAAKAQIDAWSQVKYAPKQSGAELPIEIVGQQSEWRIRYPGSRRFQDDPLLGENFAKESLEGQGQADDLNLVNELHLWKDGKVQIHLKSADVPHTFFMPTARLKQESVPRQVTDVWLRISESNVAWDAEASDWKRGDEWDFVCPAHSVRMRGQVLVHESKDDFLKWLKRAEELRLPRPVKE